MKFGASLGQRSIPQWAHCMCPEALHASGDLRTDFGIDNVDYDELKTIIKDRTSHQNGDPADPVSIPGQDAEPESWKQLENELFDALEDQRRRVSLFAKSKYGELERRLGSQGSHLASHTLF